MSVENIQLKLKQKINIKGNWMRGCSLLPDGKIVLSCFEANTLSFINKEGVELFQIGKDKTGSSTYDTVYIKDNNSVAGIITDDIHVPIIVYRDTLWTTQNTFISEFPLCCTM
jgi:hypothetical protein